MLKKIDLRLIIICSVAASVGLSMALISIIKFILMIYGLIAILFRKLKVNEEITSIYLFTPVTVLTIIFVFSISLFWTVAPQIDAMGSIAKYGKLLVIILIPALIRNHRDAMYALASFALVQLFLMLSSWMLFFQLPIPWATSNMALTQYAVFSSYLDQGIISAVFAFICWHLRSLITWQYGKPICIIIALAALLNVLFVLNGRTGHVIVIALISISIMWELPKKYRILIIVIPFLLTAILLFSSSKLYNRLSLVKTEVQSYSVETSTTSSSGIRLGLWSNSIQMIAEHPIVGSGVGSWSSEYNRLQRQINPLHSDIKGNFNPHQEYLLWGVQLGSIGLILIGGLFFSILLDSRKMEKHYSNALQSTLIALAISCLFNSSIYDALIGDFFCVTIGMLLALGLNKTPLISKPIV